MPPQVIHVRNASKVAAALANEKCQKILEYLSKRKDATETQISKDLIIALSTVHYNMKVLSEAHLVIDDEYRYSSKGKEVTHYRINKNPIVIVQEEQQLDLLKAIVPAALIAAGIGFAYSLIKSTPMQLVAQESNAMDAAAGAMMKAAPMAAEMVPVASEPSMFPWFLAGVILTLILSFCFLLVYRWKNRH